MTALYELLTSRKWSKRKAKQKASISSTLNTFSQDGERTRIFCDITWVVVTTTACGIFLQCLLRSQSGMFSWLRRLFHRENGDQGETRPRQKESAIPSCKNRRMKSFWERHMSAGKTSSQNCNITNHMKNMNKLDDMKFYIRKINAERLELFRILDIDMNTDLNYRMNIEFTIIKSQHEKTMLDMEKMTQSISDTIEKYKEFIEDKDSYRCEILQQKLEHGTDQDKVSFEENICVCEANISSHPQ